MSHIIYFQDAVDHSKFAIDIEKASSNIPEPPTPNGCVGYDCQFALLPNELPARWITQDEVDALMTDTDNDNWNIWLQDFNAVRPMPGGADCSECGELIPEGTPAVCVSGCYDINGEAWAHEDCAHQCGRCGRACGPGWITVDDEHQDIMCKPCQDVICTCGHRDHGHICFQSGPEKGKLGPCGDPDCECKRFTAMGTVCICPSDVLPHLAPCPFAAKHPLRTPNDAEYGVIVRQDDETGDYHVCISGSDTESNFATFGDIGGLMPMTDILAMQAHIGKVIMLDVLERLRVAREGKQ